MKISGAPWLLVQSEGDISFRFSKKYCSKGTRQKVLEDNTRNPPLTSTFTQDMYTSMHMSHSHIHTHTNDKAAHS